MVQSPPQGRLLWLKAVDGPIMKYSCSMAAPALLALLLSCTGAWAADWEVASVSCEAQLVNHGMPESCDRGAVVRRVRHKGVRGRGDMTVTLLSSPGNRACFPSGSQREFRCLGWFRVHLGARGPAECRCRCAVSRHGGASWLGETSHSWSDT